MVSKFKITYFWGEGVGIIYYDWLNLKFFSAIDIFLLSTTAGYHTW